MNKFEQVKNFYELGTWSKSRVHDAVIKGWITAQEYEQITGEAYE